MKAACKILLTGPPRIGKTTIILKLVQKLNNRAGGFFTQEIREGGQRVGFAIETIDGKRGILARADLATGPRVGKYRVALHDLEMIGIPALRTAAASGQIVLLDEIGKMEMYSGLFGETVKELLTGPAPVVATIALHGDDRIQRYKSMPSVQLIMVSENNRDGLPDELLRKLMRF